MKLRTKILLVCSITIGLAAGALGGYATYSTWQNEISKIDSALDVLANSAGRSDDPLGTALLNISSAPLNTELAFYSVNEDLTVLGDVDGVISHIPTLKEMDDATQHSVTLKQGNVFDFRLRSTALEDGEYLLFAVSLEQPVADTWSTFNSIASFAGLSMALAIALIWMLTRRDLKRIEQLIRQAQKISSGNYDIDIRLTGRSSEIDRLNDSLIRMAESLTSTVTLERELQHRMKEFVADASHELRTPLTIIKGYFELLSTQQGSSSELEQKGAKRISNQIQRMQNLVDDLLLLAELDREVEDDFDVVDLSERLQNALNDLNALKNHPSLRVNVPPNIRIKADDRLIDQLLGNLISNVSRYVPENETLQVTLAAERAFAVLTFDDSGPGLPSKAYGQPIQRFTRFDNSRSRELGGSGLGLSIMSAIVQKHSGHLIMKASDLGGLHTTIRLPLALND